MKRLIMDGLSHCKYGIALSVVLLALAATVLAQDPPGRAGRLNYLTGSVSFRPAGLDDWAPAEVNLTISTGDRLWTDSGSRAEMHIGATALRMASQTDLDILNVDDETTQLSVSQGTLCIHIHHLYSNEIFEVDTPNSSISLLRAGSYRIDVDPDGHQSRVSVHSGDAEVTSEGSVFPVRPNQLALVYGTDNLDYDIRPIGPADEWDNWCGNRERHESELAEQHYVSTEMTGYEDLAGYGSWRNDPDVGAVWVPSNVGSDWAPYESGHWYWRGYWGWTWVDDAPWGYAPFHYGRWAFIGGYWGWCPGVYIERPFFAPALVAFIGFGGGVAWFPLGPHEVFVPGYHVSEAYFHTINVTHVNVTNIHNVNINREYVNRNIHGAVHGMSQKDFANGHHVAGGGKGEKFGTGPVTGMHAPIAPNKQSLLGGKGGKAASPPSSSLHRAIVAKNAPPSVTPFSKQQAGLKSAPGQPLGRQQVASTGGGFQSKSFRSASVSSTGAGLRPARSGIAATRSLSGSRATTTGGGKTVGSTGAGGIKGGGGSTSGGGKTKGAPLDSFGKSGGTGSGTKGMGSTRHGRDSLDRGAGTGSGTGKGGSLEGGGSSKGTGGKSTGKSTGGSLTGPGGKGTGSGSSAGGARKTGRGTSRGGSSLGSGGGSTGGGSTSGGGHKTHKSTAGMGGGSAGGGHSTGAGTGRSTGAGTRRSSTSGTHSTGGGSTGGGSHSTGGAGQHSTGGSGQHSTGGGGQRSTGGGGQRPSFGGGTPRGGGGASHSSGGGAPSGGGGKKKH